MKCVYCLDFPDGKRYVGSTKDLEKRLLNHNRPSNGKSNPDLKAALLNKYETVILEVLPEHVTQQDLRTREQHYIDLWWDYGILYNMNKRADCPPNQKGRVAWNKNKPAYNRGKKVSPAYQSADKIRADRAAGTPVYTLREKYNCCWKVLKDILSAVP